MSHLHGKFVWFELATSDTARARSFYGELLGWKVEETALGPIKYSMIKNGDASIGGLVALEEKGAKSHWTSYLSVADVDGVAKKAAAAGGKILKPAFAYPNVGRMALIQDSVGAELYLFKSDQDDAADKAATAAGDFFWNELWTSDAKKAVAFYKEVAGFTVDEMNMGEMTYHVVNAGGVPRGGIMPSPDPKIPPHWLPYVHVNDTDQTAARAKKLGGEIRMAATDIPTIGRFAVIGDPTGGTIAVIKPEKKG